MAEFWRTKRFKDLSHAWKIKLDESGFTDHEIELKGDRALKQRATNSYRQASQLERETRLEYYSLLGELTNKTFFGNTLDKFVMSRHADGATIKEIIEDLAAKGLFRERQTIRYIIRRWQTAWGIKNWSLRQRNLRK